ncbi:MAG: hypothetical protein L3J43_09225 [Sulfurovum sp.]|nr:hypothetical protein [Sulfurovum sp.]
MPRIPRGETVGGIYHIINRGNMRMQVFDDMDDYEYFLELLEKASKRENVKELVLFMNALDLLLF